MVVHGMETVGRGRSALLESRNPHYYHVDDSNRQRWHDEGVSFGKGVLNGSGMEARWVAMVAVRSKSTCW